MNQPVAALVSIWIKPSQGSPDLNRHSGREAEAFRPAFWPEEARLSCICAPPPPGGAPNSNTPPPKLLPTH